MEVAQHLAHDGTAGNRASAAVLDVLLHDRDAEPLSCGLAVGSLAGDVAFFALVVAASRRYVASPQEHDRIGLGDGSFFHRSFSFHWIYANRVRQLGSRFARRKYVAAGSSSSPVRPR